MTHRLHSTIAPAAAATAVAIILSMQPAAAVRPLEPHAPQAVQAKTAATPNCRTLVLGVDSANRFLIRYVVGRAVRGDATSVSPLPYDVTDIGAAATTGTHHGANFQLVAVSNYQPQLLTVQYRRTRSDLHVDASAGVETDDFSSDLFASVDAKVPLAYTYNAGGDITRWTMSSDSGGVWSLTDPQVVLRSLAELTTLSAEARARIDGVKTDVMIATTSTGALVRILVPVDDPLKASPVMIARRGFKTTTGLSLSSCNSDPSYLSIIAIDNVANTATWLTVRRQFSARPVSPEWWGRIPGRFDWRIHATL
jgi:hypothetical protein